MAWHLLEFRNSRRGVEAAERWLELEPPRSRDEDNAFSVGAYGALSGWRHQRDWWRKSAETAAASGAAYCCVLDAWQAARFACDDSSTALAREVATTARTRVARKAALASAARFARERFACLLRDLFVIRPSAPRCPPRPSGAVLLAQAIYDERAFDRLPILADTLASAGCAAPDILAHLRSPGPHVRGCWAVDLVLGKG